MHHTLCLFKCIYPALRIFVNISNSEYISYLILLVYHNLQLFWKSWSHFINIPFTSTLTQVKLNEILLLIVEKQLCYVLNYICLSLFYVWVRYETKSSCEKKIKNYFRKLGKVQPLIIALNLLKIIMIQNVLRSLLASYISTFQTFPEQTFLPSSNKRISPQHRGSPKNWSSQRSKE